MPNNKTIVAVVDDLMFVVKINEAAKRAGFDVTFARSEADLLAYAKNGPSLIILDLNCNSVDTLRAAEALKAEPDTRKINVLAYLSHVQGDLKLKAQEAGIDTVMARSALSQNLHIILKRHAGRY